MTSTASHARRAFRAALYTYPDHLLESVERLPRTPGVYTFHGEAGLLPLYIGKSVNIRARVMDHMRTAEEAALLRQARTVSCQPTAGDLGARLLEAQRIKQESPLYNRLLRRLPRQFSLRLYRGQISIVNSSDLDLTTAPMLFGLYSSERAAKEALRRLADEQRLCYALLGLERLPPGRACFRSTLRQCLGACYGAECQVEHEHRLRAALERLEIAAWPFGGPVVLEERGASMTQFHRFDAWEYRGSAPTLARAKRLQQRAVGFDRDAYRIIRQALDSGGHRVFPL